MVKRAIVEIDEEKCNGCGQCVPKCAEGVLKIVDGKARLVSDVYCDGLGACLGTCPQGAIKVTEREAPAFDEEATKEYQHAQRRPSKLRNWPVQLNLVNPRAPFFKGADLLIMADCVPVASPDWQGTLLKGQVVLVGCPKFDDVPAYLDKLTTIFRENDVKRVTIVHMEVPCCHGLAGLVSKAIKDAGKKTPLERLVLSVEGEPLEP
ncbi:MAG: 4Fe-4S binding protein [Candidatus Bathyarchaeota archaeon]|nr:4Fe-4S binding protein [Candidatus Bathyarchaeota archaeon]